MTTPHHPPADGWGSTDRSAGEDVTPPPGCPAHADATRLYGPRFQHNTAQVYREMRRNHGPVAPVLLEGDVPAWLVLGYRELHYVSGLAAANADPHVRPDSYEGAGGNHAYMSFSHGEHRCPYPAQEIAEVITWSAVEVLLDRLPDVALAVPAGALVWRPTVWSRGLTALPVQFTPV